jgi:hypothetical protein
MLAFLALATSTMIFASPMGDFFTKVAAEATSVWALAFSLIAVVWAGWTLIASDHGKGAAIATLIGVVLMQTAARMVTWLQ